MVLGGTIAGCAVRDESSVNEGGRFATVAEEARSRGYHSQADTLADDSVTESEYRNAVDQVFDCIRTAGFEVDGPWLNPVDSVQWLYLAGGENTDSVQVQMECEEQYLSFVVPAFLDTHEPRMAEPLLAFVRDCLGGRSIETRGGEASVEELRDSVGDSGNTDLNDCIRSGARTVYPDLPFVAVGG